MLGGLRGPPELRSFANWLLKVDFVGITAPHRLKRVALPHAGPLFQVSDGSEVRDRVATPQKRPIHNTPLVAVWPCKPRPRFPLHQTVRYVPAARHPLLGSFPFSARIRFGFEQAATTFHLAFLQLELQTGNRGPPISLHHVLAIGT